MPAEFPLPAVSSQRWPCGPDCRHAQPLAGTYGEWLWCHHPSRGGHVAREGRDCPRFQPSLTTVPIPPLPFHRDQA